jgi:hypothetical protein
MVARARDGTVNAPKPTPRYERATRRASSPDAPTDPALDVFHGLRQLTRLARSRRSSSLVSRGPSHVTTSPKRSKSRSLRSSAPQSTSQTLRTAGLALTTNSTHEYTITTDPAALPPALSQRLTAALRRRTAYTNAELSLLIETRDGNRQRLGEASPAATTLLTDDLIELDDTTGYLNTADDVAYSLRPAGRR